MRHKARECMHCKGVMVHTSTLTTNFLFSTESFTCAQCRKKVSIHGYVMFGLFILFAWIVWIAYPLPVNVIGALFFCGIAAPSAYMHRMNPRIGTVEAEITRVVRR